MAAAADAGVPDVAFDGLDKKNEEPEVKPAEHDGVSTDTSDGNIHDKSDSETTGQHATMGRRDSAKQKTVLKQGNLKVKQDGQMVYKKTASQAIMSATQLGIGYTVGRLSAKPERDVLMVDFYFVEKVWFPAHGSKETPSHKYDDFRFKTYAPVAFRYFRDLFGILPSDFLISLANEPIREISNPGASGSLFFVSNDDLFIVKTVQHKEATFLQQLLPGYYMNLHQNPRTLLPKFFGLYCYQSGSSNIRLTVMNNLLPSQFKCHMKFDLKGSTYKRKANKAERAKKSPTYKDLDFMEIFPDGILLDAPTYDVVIKTISRDVRVLESFQIMDYSFLLGIHNIDQAQQEREQEGSPSKEGKPVVTPEQAARRNEFGAALEAIQMRDGEEVRPVGGVNAKTSDGQRLILFIGIIDILQSYRFLKKAEHTWKSMFMADGDTVSVHKPSFYAKRFLDFIKGTVFKRIAPVQRGPSKRKSLKAMHAVHSSSSGPAHGTSTTSDHRAHAGPSARSISQTSASSTHWEVAVENVSSTSTRKVRISTPDAPNINVSNSGTEEATSRAPAAGSPVFVEDVVFHVNEGEQSGSSAVDTTNEASPEANATVHVDITNVGNGKHAPTQLDTSTELASTSPPAYDSAL